MRNYHYNQGSSRRTDNYNNRKPTVKNFINNSNNNNYKKAL